jgi:hypothetical protein
MANKKVSQLVSKPSVLVTDLFPIADPTTGQLYKTTISDLGTAIGSGVSSVNTLVGAVVLDTDDIQELASPTNRWFTDTRARAAVSASSPLAYNSGTGVFSIPAATSSQNGYLTSTDWTTFNAKQAALSGTGFVKISGTTISYDNSTYLTTSAAASTYLALAGGTLTGALNGTSATFTGDLTISSANPRLYFTDTDNNPDYFISNTDGTFTVYDVTNSTSRFTIGTTGNGTFGGNLTVGQIIRSGGTSAQFLKADGSIDSSTYLTTGTASSTYLALAGGTLTGAVTGTRLVLAQNSADITLSIVNAGTGRAFSVLGTSYFSSDISFGSLSNGILKANALGALVLATAGTDYQAPLSGTGFVKISGSTISYDNSTYLTTSSASSTYLALGGGTLTGALFATSASFSGFVGFGGNTSPLAAIDVTGAGRFSSTISAAGATLTGALSGTSASFSSNVNVTANNALNEGIAASVIRQNGASGNNGLVVDVTNTPNAYIADFRLANSSVFRINAAGNVGIGTSFIPSGRKLAVSGGAQFNGAALMEGANFTILPAANGQDGVLLNVGYDTGVDYGSLFINTGGNTSMILNKNGAATFSSSVTTSGNNIFNNSGGRAIDAVSTGVLFAQNGGAHNIIFGDGNVRYYSLYTPSGAAYGSIRNFSTSSDILTFTSAGNVGIGTTAPSNLLHVAGVGRFDTGIYFNNSGTNGAFLWQIANESLRFGTNDTERMRITSGGDVLIGATSAGSTEKFNVTQSGANWAMALNHTNSTQFFVDFRSSGTQTGSIIAAGGVTSYNVTSDYRLKEDLKSINGLDIVNKINIYDYKYKSSGIRMDGVLAHELAEVLPYAVFGVKDGEQMQQVDYSKIVPVMVQAIKELKAKIETLENK